MASPSDPSIPSGGDTAKENAAHAESGIVPATVASDATLARMLEAVQSLTGLDAQRVETISQLAALDAQRVATIQDLRAENARLVLTIDETATRMATVNHSTAVDQTDTGTAGSGGTIARILDTVRALTTLDSQRVGTIQTMTALDAGRVETIHKLLAENARLATTINDLAARLTTMDGLSMAGRNLTFLDEPVFRAAWETAKAHNVEGWPSGVPDIRMRAHLALWAAKQAVMLDGDFVECGVHTGLLSLVICHALKFERQSRVFYLFDTFNGIPIDSLPEADKARGRAANEAYYRDVWRLAERNFKPFPNAHLVRGALPGTLGEVAIEKIAYLSVDLNNAPVEGQVIATLWPKVVAGGVVLIDDYAWQGLEAQFELWNEFSRQVGVPIAALPTGQGLMIKPAVA